MYLFNKEKFMRFLKSTLHLSSLILILISCGGKEKHPESYMNYSSNAPFIAEQITKPENLVKAINFIEKNGLKNIFIVNLSTCLKDAFKKDNSIQEASFIIEYENKLSADNKKTKIQVTSDVNGCIRWEEEYRYRYIIQPKWIVLKRTIKKESGAYSGQIEIPLAINPWLEISNEKFPEILDLRASYSEKHPVFRNHPYEKNGLEYLFKNDSTKYPQLWAPEVDVQIEKQLSDKTHGDKDIKSILESYQNICNNEVKENCYKRDLTISLAVPLKLRTYSLQKDLVDEVVKGGSYNVNLQLLSIPDINKKAYRIHENICDETIHIINKTDLSQKTKYINISCSIPISYFSQHANYKLALEVNPREGLPFTKFQGIYTINLTQEIKNGSLQTYTIDNDIDNHYKSLPVEVSIIENMNIKYVYNAIKKKNDKQSETKKLSDLGFRPVYLDVKLIKATFSNVENDENCADNETVAKRKVRFIGQACIQDTLTDYRNKQVEFRIFIEDENTKEIKEVFSDTRKKTIPIADADGCISWPDSIEHKNFNRQIYFPRKIHFLSEKLNLYGTTSVGINPWQRAFQSYQDISQLNRNEIRTDVKGVAKPEMVINQFKSVNLFPSYVLDKFLNINMFHSLYFLFQPFVNRLDNIALGRLHGARETLRDGYYSLRILLLRNPQETGDISRIIDPKTIDAIRSTPVPRKYQQDEKYINKIVTNNVKGKYITHIDTIIKASANFVNIYMPLYFTTEQFFYLASRNLISIEVIPFDPSGFKFKPLVGKTTTCEIDFENTVWKPYFDHDLIVKPYVGVFQVQNWTNWNILQPMADDFNTDKIIDADEIGKKYRHFNLHSGSDFVKSAELKPITLEYEKNFCTNEDMLSKDFDIESCNPSAIKNKTIGLADSINEYYKKGIDKNLSQSPKDVEKNISSEDLIDNFSERNSLKVVNLYEEDGDRFVKDLNLSFNKTNRLNTDIIERVYQIIDSISDPEIKKDLESQINQDCNSSPITGFLAKFMVTNAYLECLSQVLDAHLAHLIKQENSNLDFNDLSLLEENLKRKSEIKKILRMITDKQQGLPYKVSSVYLDKVFNHLENIIDRGILKKDRKKQEILTFAKSLCGFWLDSFLKKYLTSQEMRTAYTNYIKDFDYYRVLENDNLEDVEKGDFIISFMNMISNGETTGEQDLKKCHVDYGKCILFDHCKLRDYSRVSKTYCNKSLELEDTSCLKIVKEECQKNSSTSVCLDKLTSKSCHTSLNNFCKINLNHTMCKRYHSRCLTGYHVCTESNSIAEEFETSIKDTDLFKIETAKKGFIGSLVGGRYKNPIQSRAVLESCLKDPFKFFNMEFKMFIDEISDDLPKYVGGFAGNLGVGGSFSTGSYMNWTSQRGTSIGLKHSMGANFNFLGVSLTAMDVNIAKSISSNLSNSSRRAIDVRVAEAAFLVISRATFDINVTKFKKCLIVKPSNNAFFASFEDGIWEPFDKDIWNDDFNKNAYKKVLVSRPGLMICNPKKQLPRYNPETIRESYYYISQAMVDPSNSQFLNLYDLANRPFMAILRGRQEFLKYFYALKAAMEGVSGDLEKNSRQNELPANMFVNYPHPLDEAISFSLSQREFQKTGFHPGVYSYANAFEQDFNSDFVTRNSFLDKVFKSYEKTNYFLSIPKPPSSDIPIVDY